MATEQRVTVQEHESRRFRQIAALERELQLQESEIIQSKEHTKELQKVYDGILGKLRAAARDEGELPLLDMMDQVSATHSASTKAN